MILTYKHCAFYRRGECEKLGMYNGFIILVHVPRSAAATRLKRCMNIY